METWFDTNLQKIIGGLIKRIFHTLQILGTGLNKILQNRMPCCFFNIHHFYFLQTIIRYICPTISLFLPYRNFDLYRRVERLGSVKLWQPVRSFKAEKVPIPNPGQNRVIIN
jgi:hypothetical protein